MINKAHDLGYETTANIMAISTETEPDIGIALVKLAESPVDVVYAVDSFGALYCEQVKNLVHLFKKHLSGKEIGIPCPNSLQLEFADTIEGITQGAVFADGSLYEMGRGSGNCCLMLLMAFLENPKLNLTPILEVIKDYIRPMRKDFEWGYIIPYIITGMLNEHPRSAMAMRKTADKENYAQFYKKMRDAVT